MDVQAVDPRTERPLLKKQLKWIERQRREATGEDSARWFAAILGTTRSSLGSGLEVQRPEDADICCHVDLAALEQPHDWLFDGPGLEEG